MGSGGRSSPEPQENPFVKNERFNRASLDFHVPTTVRPRGSVELSNVGTGRPRSSVADLIMRVRRTEGQDLRLLLSFEAFQHKAIVFVLFIRALMFGTEVALMH